MSAAPRTHGPARTTAGLLAALGVLLAGCAQFPEEHTEPWRDQPSLKPQAGPQPSVEKPEPPPPPPQPPQPDGRPEACRDDDPAVVATCLDPVGAIAVLPGGDSAFVGERATGRILRVQRDREPVEIARIPVEATGGGGLSGLALSPSYAEDELIYAYVTTPGDNRVVRVAAGDSPKPVLTGIPKGSTGNSGALLADERGALLVATGDGGSPSAAADPRSLAGKVLRIDPDGRPLPDNPDPTSPVWASGLNAPGGLCGVPGGASYWVTNRAGAQDELHQIQPGARLDSPGWTWRDHPGVSGCVATPDSVVVSLNRAAALYTLHPAPGGTFSGQPTKVMDNTYGRFSAAALADNGMLWLGTTNKAGGRPVPSDDRVIVIEPPSGGTAGKD